MNTYHRPPSEEGLSTLAALKTAVASTLDKKKKLGHYAVVWKNGEVTLKQFPLDSTEMSDEEFQNIKDKRGYLNQWK